MALLQHLACVPYQDCLWPVACMLNCDDVMNVDDPLTSPEQAGNSTERCVSLKRIIHFVVKHHMLRMHSFSVSNSGSGHIHTWHMTVY